MDDFDQLMSEADAEIQQHFGAPCTYLKQSVDDRIATSVIVDKNVQVVGKYVDVIEFETHGSLLVSVVGDARKGDVIVFADMAYHVVRPISNDGSEVMVQLLADPELHLGLKTLEPAGYLNQFVHHEWGELWRVISTRRSVPLTGG
ncbi:hypothetical protein [Endozoicomonas lisbonensis]|uniref:hypothetical protein n=1 Tax=Endozoicomonas lisbonensis TaxID=3120522 RepID=UPI0033964403